MSEKLSIVNNAEPPEALIQEAIDHILKEELAQFADHLDTARRMWRQFRELVEQPEFPAALITAYADVHGCRPDDDNLSLAGVDAMQPQFREIIRPRAVKIARSWRKQQQIEKEKLHQSPCGPVIQ
jgi:hypothetical protein